MRFTLLACSLLLTACTAGSGPAGHEEVSTVTPPPTVLAPVPAPVSDAPIQPSDLTQKVEDLIPVTALPVTAPSTPIVIPAPLAPASTSAVVSTDKTPEAAPTDSTTPPSLP